MEPARPDCKWRIGRQQAIGIGCLSFTAVVMATAYVLLLLYPPRGTSSITLCLSNVVKVTGAVLEYAEQHNGTLPQSGTWRKDITPYFRDGAEESESLLRCPVTGKAYVLNGKLAGQTMNELGNPAGVPLVWEARTDNGRPPHEGRFNVGFLDGHAKLVDEAAFSELMTRGR